MTNFIPTNPTEAIGGFILFILVLVLLHSGTPRNRR